MKCLLIQLMKQKTSIEIRKRQFIIRHEVDKVLTPFVNRVNSVRERS